MWLDSNQRLLESRSSTLARLSYTQIFWWRISVLPRSPPACKTGALLNELIPLKVGAGTRIRTPDFLITKQTLWPTELCRHWRKIKESNHQPLGWPGFQNPFGASPLSSIFYLLPRGIPRFIIPRFIIWWRFPVVGRIFFTSTYMF